MLVCCMNDLVPAYFVCVKVPKDTPVPGCWVKLTGVLHARYHELYKQKGAVIAVETIEQCCALVREEAVF